MACRYWQLTVFSGHVITHHTTENDSASEKGQMLQLFNQFVRTTLHSDLQSSVVTALSLNIYNFISTHHYMHVLLLLQFFYLPAHRSHWWSMCKWFNRSNYVVQDNSSFLKPSFTLHRSGIQSKRGS